MRQIELKNLRLATATWQSAPFIQNHGAVQRQPNLTPTTFTSVQQVQAAVSPDCSYRLVEAALRQAQQEICLYIYNISADHLLELLREAQERGVHIRLMYDVTDTRGNEQEKLLALGVDLKPAPSVGERRVFTVCHQKFAVIDEEISLLGSANWAGTAIPQVETPGKYKKGNREWLVRVDDRAVARWFRNLFESDWSIPALPLPAALSCPAELPPPPQDLALPMGLNRPEQIFDIHQVNSDRPIRLTPLISPDNYYDIVRKLILAAKTSIDIEQQYILAGGPQSEGLLRALAKRKAEVAIRILVSPAYRRVGELDNWELSLRSLDAFGLKGCLRAMNLNYFIHLHNKGVIVDRQQVIISSTNWSENSLTRAREAGLLLESAAIAAYYSEVFDYDWSIAIDPTILPANAPDYLPATPVLPSTIESIHPADLI